MVKRLMEETGMTADSISDALEQRVSRRTIYRWAKGESAPQQKSDLDALQQFYATKFPT
jgi:transcriptional regulator with XRE-family HTH domain